MLIGERLCQLREQRDLSQGDIEKRTGLLRSYVSRVENDHTVPSVETLEKFARALEVPLFQIFYEGDERPSLKALQPHPKLWGSSGKDAQLVAQFRRSLSNVKAKDRKLLLHMARKLAKGKAK
jgi:transcriptional regulator with XRE-family HTH domain